LWNLCVIIVKNDGSPVVRTPLENSLLMLVLLPYCPTNTACHAKLEGSPPCQGGSESSTLLVTGLRDQTLCRYNHYIVLLVHNTKVYIEIPQMNTTVSTSQVWLRLLKAVLNHSLFGLASIRSRSYGGMYLYRYNAPLFWSVLQQSKTDHDSPSSNGQKRTMKVRPSTVKNGP
jgi:hypothetical protein